MSSVADIPSEARCKQLVYELVTKQKHHECGQRIAWRYGRDYGWCRVCRMKIRPKARTWFESTLDVSPYPKVRVESFSSVFWSMKSVSDRVNYTSEIVTCRWYRLSLYCTPIDVNPFSQHSPAPGISHASWCDQYARWCVITQRIQTIYTRMIER